MERKIRELKDIDKKKLTKLFMDNWSKTVEKMIQNTGENDHISAIRKMAWDEQQLRNHLMGIGQSALDGIMYPDENRADSD